MTDHRPLLLLIDDDPFVRGSTADLLSRQLRVLTAASAEEGLEILQVHPHIDAIISDITMPGMGPVGLYNRLPLRLQRRMGLVTGGIADPLVQTAVDRLQLPFLLKPFTRTALADLVSLLLCTLDEDTADLQGSETETALRSPLAATVG